MCVLKSLQIDAGCRQAPLAGKKDMNWCGCWCLVVRVGRTGTAGLGPPGAWTTLGLDQTAFLVKVKVLFASMGFVFACVEICNSVGVLSKSRQQLALTHFRWLLRSPCSPWSFSPRCTKGGVPAVLKRGHCKVWIAPPPYNNMYIWNLYIWERPVLFPS